MSVREEDRQKNCPSRGLGIAAAAIGVGVGAALYYFFNKRSENPDDEGSTSNWSTERPHALHNNSNEEDNSFFTVSEHSTSDTSMHDTSTDSSSEEQNTSDQEETDFNSSSDMSIESEDTSSTNSSFASEMSVDSNTSSESEPLSRTLETALRVPQMNESYYRRQATENGHSHVVQLNEPSLTHLLQIIGTPMIEETDTDGEWDVTTSSVGVPSVHRRSPFRAAFNTLTACYPRLHTGLNEEEKMSQIRNNSFRSRSWSLEDCSICFDVMLQTQEVMELSCTHRFHQQCILPWLQEKQTCPNCRKVAECESKCPCQTRKAEPVILEYFENGDTNAAAEEFLEFITPNRSHLICETIVEIALDHKPSHCEMASFLISDLYGRVFSAKDIAIAFERLLEKLPDLTLDTPDAAVMLSNFIARCVADDCLPPKFVHAQAQRELGSHARQAIHRAETLLSLKQGLVRLDNIWGVGGGIRPVKSLIRQIQLLLKEYLTSGDLSEAMRCVKELEVPHFHHELVYETVLLALETVNSSVEEQLCTFLAELRRCVIVTPDQMDRGFLRVLEDMNDIVLDVPLAYIMLDRFLERAQHKFRLGDAVLKRAPTRGRKRFVSEGDGGAIKDHALKLRE